MSYFTIEELYKKALDNKKKISEIVIEDEIINSEKSRKKVISEMKRRYDVMKSSIEKGLRGNIKSITGLTGGDAARIKNINTNLLDSLHNKIISAAIAIAEVNASMGKIVAAPTAGSSGIIPAVIWGISEYYDLDEEKCISALFTAGVFGKIVNKKMNLSGAAGGCQAECGVASGMAAAAAVEMLGGSSEMVIHGFALALKNLLGLTCDPVAGLVEIPCIKRNGFAAAHALTAAQMALSGIKSIIPADQVVDALYRTGELMPSSLKETSQAGLADTDTARDIVLKLNMCR